ncbi:MAG: hypothetical protein K6G11_09745 [Lachnospiraceae bacterium]|nr:hypothetical protein [Lachnospiraceae bacterium]
MGNYQNLFTIHPGNSMTFGVTQVANGVQFSVYLPDSGKCELKLYKKGHVSPQIVIDLTEEYKWGSVYFVIIDKHPKNPDKRSIEQILSEDYEYTYETNKGEVLDYYARSLHGRENWGTIKNKDKIRSGIELQEFDWENDLPPRRPFNEVIMYQLHVRGFTKHRSSKVKNKGTFAGVTEKIDYIKDLGVNAIMLLPCYEFDEVLCETSYGEPSDFYANSEVGKSDRSLRKMQDNEKKAEAIQSAKLGKASDTAKITVKAEEDIIKADKDNAKLDKENTKAGNKNSGSASKGKTGAKAGKEEAKSKKTAKGASSKVNVVENTEKSSVTDNASGAVGTVDNSAFDLRNASNAQRGQMLAGWKEPKVKINYWGYGTNNTYYFAPKASYAGPKKNPCDEMKKMVKAFHKEGIEVLMDIYFSPGTNINLMTDCLRHWVLDYHIDGFRVNNDVYPSIVGASDPILSGVKLIISYWDVNEMKRAEVVRDCNAFAEYNDGFMNDARRFLKSDEGMTGAFISRFYRNPKEYSVINYISCVNGFTLMDLVSYDIKHNDDNGEHNTDGTDFNYSWNCGVEGFSRKKAIVRRRMNQIRNALVMMFLSQGTPMLLAGDEMGNTQYGNNNPYCQDNKVTWLDWSKLDTYREIHDYIKNLIAFRKQYPVLHQKDELMFMDRLGVGMPDISIHSTVAWKSDYSNYNRMLGILLYGDYVNVSTSDDAVGLRRQGKVESGDSIYIIFNMYWEAKYFDLPQLPDNKEWYIALETFSGEFKEIPKPKKKTRKKIMSLADSRRTMVPARSIVVFVGR